ncbi:TerC family protein [Paenibacillus hunanensis]|uniref:YkoY family integral membrane protein n=1 Tax=Paenibacillus hunanensis TaxID=539262 RepID=A0ABU1IXU9_9BACL|nr:TerC family protein [Paenibacillus hunanensis]MCL9660832.1 TerC family protein [Paenibacillus hunanensis]MDR6244079.1 YkoY family integral membrane protein [Paenibacillus hunanensis]GGJ14813.1 membrane protein [Paenibacillus hunanensis]
MDAALLLEYGWVLLVLIALEGLLAADNALVLAIMVKHLPEEQRKKALFYGLFGAFVFRFGSLFLISFLVDVWQVQAIGALYLLYISINHIVRHFFSKSKTDEASEDKGPAANPKKQSGFWMTVFKVEVADIAFAVDSILAAVALAVALPASGLPPIGGLDGGQFIVIFLGGLIGLIIMRFAASFFVKLLQERPGLEIAAFVIVGWVGVKLAVITLAHPALAVIPEHFPENKLWKLSFYVVLVAIALAGWFLSSKREVPAEDNAVKEVKQEIKEDL